jgi:glycosyltransferase involved in cell wall biosynthesis
MSKLFVVSRHFWPVCNETSYRLAELVRFFNEHDIEAEIITTRWHSKWPATCSFMDRKVTRILPPISSPWSEAFSTRNIWQWIERYSTDAQTIYIDSLSLLSGVKFSSALKEKRIIVRFDGSSKIECDCLRRPSASLDWLMRNEAASFLVSNAASHRNLVASGVLNASIVRTDPVCSAESFQRHHRESSRTILSELSTDFALPNNAPLIVCFFSGEGYDEEKQLLRMMVDALERNQLLRAWILGAGDSLRRHYAFVRDMGYHHDILFLSPFDDLKLLYQAADLVMCPFNRVGQAYYYPQAIAHGIPTMLTSEIVLKSTDRTMTISEMLESVRVEPLKCVETFNNFLSNPRELQTAAAEVRQKIDWQRITNQQMATWRAMLPADKEQAVT